MKKISTREITQIAILGTVSAILLFVNFPLLFVAPSFYKFDISDVAGLIGGFALGPVSAIYIQIIKFIINIIIEGGSETMFVGETASLIMSLAFILPASIIYKRNRTRKGAVVSLIVGSLSMVLVSMFANYFLIIPAYQKFMGIPLDAIIEAGSKVIPLVSSKLSLILLCVLPFNAIKAVLCSILTFLLYKRISPLLVKNR